MSEREKFAVAAHLYTRLRRNGGRAIDVQFMLRDEKYAREILLHALAQPDPEIQKLAARYNDLLLGIVRKPDAPMPSVREAAPAPVAAPSPAAAAKESEEERLLALRYRGGLR